MCVILFLVREINTMTNTKKATTTETTCPLCKDSWKDGLTVGYIRNANQTVECFQCNPTDKGLRKVAGGFERMNQKLAEIMAS